MEGFWQPLLLSLKLAVITTLLLFVVGLPLAHWLSHSKSRWTVVLESIFTLPLVLPPTVLGFYLLVAFSPMSAFGIFLNKYLNLKLVFSFEGLVVASLIYSLPFMIQPLRAGFRSLPSSLEECAWTLGKSTRTTLVKVLLPNLKPALITGIMLTFAHTIGEFGVVLMIGGGIPGVTRVASIAIYDEVESMNYSAAYRHSAMLLVLTFLILLTMNIINRRTRSEYPQ